jgi:hypothetical protein
VKTLTGSGAPQISGPIVPQSEKSQILTLRGYTRISRGVFYTASVDSCNLAEDRFLALIARSKDRSLRPAWSNLPVRRTVGERPVFADCVL